MFILREITNAFREVWRLFVDDNRFVWSVTAVFGGAAIMAAFHVETEVVAAAVVLGCLAIAIEFRPNGSG
jgi:hypothetical protein